MFEHLPTLADRPRCAPPKRSKEDAKQAERQRKAAIKQHEKDEKDKVRLRDGAHVCRLMPRCREKWLHETAHLDDKRMGGDHGLRTVANRMIRGCWFHHQGNWSLHSKDLRVECLTDEGTDGPVEIWGKDDQGREFLVGREVRRGEWERD